MKKVFIALVVLAGLVSLNSCKGDKKEEGTTDASQTEETKSETPAEETSSSQPKTFTVTATPDVVTLGKKMEASVKISNIKAVELSDPDGKSTGIELSYDVELTNKNAIGGSSVFVTPNDFRLELDNGNKLSHETYNSVTADAESSKTSTGNIFKLPAGTKPVSLNLFYDETRVTIKLEMK